MTRLHPEDLRALLAGLIYSDPQTNAQAATKYADALLIELARTAPEAFPADTTRGILESIATEGDDDVDALRRSETRWRNKANRLEHELAEVRAANRELAADQQPLLDDLKRARELAEAAESQRHQYACELHDALARATEGEDAAERWAKIAGKMRDTERERIITRLVEGITLWDLGREWVEQQKPVANVDHVNQRISFGEEFLRTALEVKP